MPELPEVETIVSGLRPALVGRRVLAVEVREPRLRVRVPAELPRRLRGRRIVSVERHGKRILMALDDGMVCVVGLGMTGRLTLRTGSAAPAPYDCLTFLLDDRRRLVYSDVRRFGRVDVACGLDAVDGDGHGIDALSPRLTPELLHRAARRRHTAVKTLLMDQRLVAGLGNIYANEILFHAGIRPRRTAHRLRRAAWTAIVEAMRAVLRMAIARGGSTIADYRDGFGRFGSYQELHAVYARAGAPCRRCGTPIRSAVLAGRSTFWCPVCQR